ncbi:MAG: MetS family NSS transporter small subunit [Lentihominibacter sp.]
MSASAIIMMIIACGGLWGGAAVFLAIMLKNKGNKEENK